MGVKDGIIDLELIEHFKNLRNETINITFDENFPEIIPEHSEHSQLLKKLLVDFSISDFYTSPIRFAMNVNEVKEYNESIESFKNSPIYSAQQFIAMPYNINILGAYIPRHSLITKLKQIIESREYCKPRIDGKIPHYFKDLKSYFKEYAKGFKSGFLTFEERELKPFLTMFADKVDYNNKVFEFATAIKGQYFNSDWICGFGFAMNSDYEIIKAFEDGERDGFYYKAWSIILANSSGFATLFQIFKDNEPHQSTENPEDNYKHIFNNEQGYKIFKAWREFTNDDTKIINFEFIFHQLQYDNYLVDDLKPSVFLNYLQSIDIPKFGRIQSKEKIQFNGKRCEKFKTEYSKIKDIS